MIETGVNPVAVTTPFLMIFWGYAVAFPTLTLDEASNIGAPKSTLPVANT